VRKTKSEAVKDAANSPSQRQETDRTSKVRCWLAQIGRTACADTQAPIEPLGNSWTSLPTPPSPGAGQTIENWQPYEDSAGAPQNKASTPTKPSTLPFRSVEDFAADPDPPAPLGVTALRCGPPPKPSRAARRPPPAATRTPPPISI
jgi:hypothetical protein